MTDLSIYINGGTKVGDNYVTQAFALYKVEFDQPAES
jgi:hypothetical protein